MAIESECFPLNIVIFHSYVSHYQRLSDPKGHFLEAIISMAISGTYIGGTYYMVQYLHYRILKFPWIIWISEVFTKIRSQQLHHQNIANVFWNKLYTLHTFTCSKPTVRLEWLEIDRTSWTTRQRSNRRGFHFWKMHKSAGFFPFGAWNLHPRRQLDRVVHHVPCLSHHWPQLIADITHLLLLTSTT